VRCPAPGAAALKRACTLSLRAKSSCVASRENRSESVAEKRRVPAPAISVSSVPSHEAPGQGGCRRRAFQAASHAHQARQPRGFVVPGTAPRMKSCKNLRKALETWQRLNVDALPTGGAAVCHRSQCAPAKSSWGGGEALRPHRGPGGFPPRCVRAWRGAAQHNPLAIRVDHFCFSRKAEVLIAHIARSSWPRPVSRRRGCLSRPRRHVTVSQLAAAVTQRKGAAWAGPRAPKLSTREASCSSVVPQK
jgi:hypothetical protein